MSQNSKMVGTAVGNLIAQQKWAYERKDTITLIATGLIWFLSAVTLPATWPAWVSIVIGIVASIAAAILTAFTKGPVTKSMKERLEGEFERVEAQIAPVAERAREHLEDASEHIQGISSEYIGQHRLAEPEGSGGIAGHYQQ